MSGATRTFFVRGRVQGRWVFQSALTEVAAKANLRARITELPDRNTAVFTLQGNNASIDRITENLQHSLRGDSGRGFNGQIDELHECFQRPEI